MSYKIKLNQAISMREQGRAEENQSLITESRNILFDLLKENPNNADINYHIGVTFDNSGFTKDAIPFYRESIDLGLNKIDLERCYLGLGSSYRLLGHYTESVEIFEKAVDSYPDNRALQIFLSIAYYNIGKYKESLELSLNNLLDTSTDDKLNFFNRPLKYYANHLDETWNPPFFEDDKDK
ncbi:tetratricopeptide repeat protein [Mammaliicoccus sciuri]|uniref:tetratricopeptide repeat protein n=1 Tax=Mammaliicoccus sciuri TaxID=1296 RepID=UPI0016262BF4|nr:tetratricopeptide repeat protein [Mammaliicoccus sciuri]